MVLNVTIFKTVGEKILNLANLFGPLEYCNVPYFTIF
jgi:hypothetical protein